VEEAGDPAVGVTERARNSLRADLEGPHRARGDALEVVEAAVRRLAEVDRDHRQRREDEQADDEPPFEGACRPRGVRGGDRPPNRGAQRRHPHAAIPWHGLSD
jgi:hypothetical protein